MNFIDATKQSLIKGKWMRRKSLPCVFVKPRTFSSTYDIVAVGKQASRNWNPSAKDVLADDWKLAKF